MSEEKSALTFCFRARKAGDREREMVAFLVEQLGGAINIGRSSLRWASRSSHETSGTGERHPERRVVDSGGDNGGEGSDGQAYWRLAQIVPFASVIEVYQVEPRTYLMALSDPVARQN